MNEKLKSHLVIFVERLSNTEKYKLKIIKNNRYIRIKYLFC